MNDHRPLISYDPSRALIAPGGVTAEQLAQWQGRLEAARSQVLADVEAFQAGLVPPGDGAATAKDPCDAGFFALPERLLQDYRDRVPGNELAGILETAGELAEAVDRVIVLGIGGSYMGARALLEACRSPYYNELSRGERGGRPRMYFEGNNLDNDATQALLELLRRPGWNAPDGKWAVVVISKSGGTIETAVAFRQFLAELERQGATAEELSRLVVPVTGASGKLAELATALGCRARFAVPDGVGGRFSVLSAVGLLPAAILGLDVVQLLEGAAAMNAHFREADVSQNVVLRYAGVCQAIEAQAGSPAAPISVRVLSVWSKALEALGLWYDQLMAESLGKQERATTPLTTVNTRDLHSRAQQHQEGRRDRLIHNLIVKQYRTDPLPVGQRTQNQDQLNDLAEKTLPELMEAAIAGTNQAYAEDHRPTADLSLDSCDEYQIGQFLQMMMLATVVEGELLEVNPYGQPGVEHYKRNMNQRLGR